MEFPKYPSIENRHCGKMGRMLAAVPATEPYGAPTRYIVTEKVDGANLQLLFTPGRPMRVGRRNGWLARGDKFFDVWTTLGRYEGDLEILQAAADDAGTSYRVVGELYGRRVLPRINYGAVSRICVFDVYSGGTRMAPLAMRDWMRALGLAHLLVPEVAVLEGVAAVLAFDPEGLRSRLAVDQPCGKAVNDMEGVVIRPLAANHRDAQGGVVMMKVKSAAFVEIETARPARGVKTPNPMADEYRAYFTASRAAGVVSKLGAPPDKASIGKTYIPALRADAQADFAKDHPDLSKAELAAVYKCSAGGFALFEPFL